MQRRVLRTNPPDVRIAGLHERITMHLPVANPSAVGHQAEKCTLQHVHLVAKVPRFLSNPPRVDQFFVAIVSPDKDNKFAITAFSSDSFNS